jgi:NAD(P)-dependent dehydrogenase (short-subunit alcohol dehydrogenase family)
VKDQAVALEFSGRTAIVLGDDDLLSAGIGERLADQGATVSVIDRNSNWSGGATSTPDILVLTLNRVSSATLLEVDDLEVTASIEGQLRRALNAVRAILPLMRDANYGRIVACVPSSGMFGADYGVAQSIAAAGVAALMKGVSQANLDRNIRANVISYIAKTSSAETLFAAHPVLDPDLFEIAAILPAITYVAHESCLLNGETVSAAAGRFAKLFTSVTLGALDPALIDDNFAALLPKVTDMRSTFSPRTVVDELITIAV